MVPRAAYHGRLSRPRPTPTASSFAPPHASSHPSSSMRPMLRIVASFLLLAYSASAAQAGEPPHWIAAGKDAAGKDADGPYRLVKTFSLDAAVQRSAVRLSADFCTATLLVN